MAHSSHNVRKKSEYLFLQGPGSRWGEFLHAFNIMVEFIKVFGASTLLGLVSLFLAQQDLKKIIYFTNWRRPLVARLLREDLP